LGKTTRAGTICVATGSDSRRGKKDRRGVYNAGGERGQPARAGGGMIR